MGERSGLSRHLDGARLWNAAAATGIAEAEWAKHFDTVSVCFSKGLGAPVGSALAGSKEAIKEARRHRKLFGGAMRQAGVIAAGALYALQNNRQRLSIDHANAQIIAEAVRAAEGLSLQPDTVETNIVIFRVEPKLGSAAEFAAELKTQRVLSLAISASASPPRHASGCERSPMPPGGQNHPGNGGATGQRKTLGEGIGAGVLADGAYN